MTGRHSFDVDVKSIIGRSIVKTSNISREMSKYGLTSYRISVYKDTLQRETQD